jgi:hypothetical protein
VAAAFVDVKREVDDPEDVTEEELEPLPQKVIRRLTSSIVVN